MHKKNESNWKLNTLGVWGKILKSFQKVIDWAAKYTHVQNGGLK